MPCSRRTVSLLRCRSDATNTIVAFSRRMTTKAAPANAASQVMALRTLAFSVSMAS